MSISIADALFLIFGLTIFGVGLVIFGVVLYLGHTKGDDMLEHFKNSSSLITISKRIDSGLRGKIRLVCSASSVVTFPRFFLKHGLVSADDIAQFPTDLRRKLVVFQWTLLTELAGIMTLGLIAMWK